MKLSRIPLFALVSTLAALGWVTPLPAAENGDLDLARRLENAFVKVAEEASAPVVVITARQEIDLGGGDGDEEEENPFEGTPFERFFRRGMPLPYDHPREMDSQGSGIIIRKDGYILTNNHVVQHASKIRVRLKDGRDFPAKVVGLDNRTDVAVIQVDAKDLPAAQLGNSDKVRVGQWAIAIGAPFQLDYSFTVGFVSATGRSALSPRGGSAYEDYIQTDASINPGNSGGPLCNIEGDVIGINTLIRGLNRGIGFAIPINLAMDVAGQLIDKGRVVRPWLGIQIEALADNEELAQSIPDVHDGVVVRSIYPDTPAARSDLKPADVIVAVDDVLVKNPRELQKQILTKKIGSQVALKIYRDAKAMTITLTTGELPDTTQQAAHPDSSEDAEAAFGITVQTLTADLAQQFQVEPGQGVVVTEVTEDSVAAEAGLEPGDVITEVDRKPVSSKETFQKAIAAGDKSKGLLVYYRREGLSAFVVLKEEPEE